VELGAAALETADHGWCDWVFEPLRGVLGTVRAEPEHSVLMNARGVAANTRCAGRLPRCRHAHARTQSVKCMSLALFEKTQGAAGPALDALPCVVRAS
jgi:hypothetical protein